jgi:hypothetical protein
MGGEAEHYSWVRIRSRDEQWSLIDEDDESGRPLRHIAKLGPYLGKPEPIYRLYLDEGYSDHASLDEAMKAGIASLG